jgi:pyrroloquinoline-quinone synthase
LIEPAADIRLEERLRGVLEKRYHHLHPFNQAMHRGELSPDQIRAWIASRFYYQQNIPVKDALLLAKLPREYRPTWITRIHTHDGFNEAEGGLEAWLSLGDAAGLEREALLQNRGLLPGVRFAVDAYVNFVRDRTWLEGVASSLTELSSKQIMSVRTVAFEEHYQWLDSEGLRYFRNRLSQAPKEAEHALAIVERHATTPELQEQVVAALNFKCDVLWALLDAVQTAYPE